MNKKNKSLILLFILLNINFFNCVDQKLTQLVETQTQKKYFVPIATTTFLALGTLTPIIFNYTQFKKSGEIKNFLKSIQKEDFLKKDFLFTGLKSLFIASSLKKEFKNKENTNKSINDHLQKISLLSLLGIYTHKTITDLLKTEKPQNLATLFEKILENFGTIGVVDAAIKGMNNNNKPLLEPSTINIVDKNHQKYAYYGLLATLICLWEYGIQKNIISLANVSKNLTDILVVYGLTNSFSNHQTNDYVKKLLIFLAFFNGIREFYKNSQSYSESISLEDITANIGTKLALTNAFNGLVNYFCEPSKENPPLFDELDEEQPTA
jgi:hypothetical protein